MILENVVLFYNCPSSQAIAVRNLKRGRVVEKASTWWKIELFSSNFEQNSHFQGVKIEKFPKCERE